METAPYINFQGRCREAMEFYHQAIGGNLDLLAGNPDGSSHPAGAGEPIFHSSLVSDRAKIFGTDGMKEYPATVGDYMAIALSGSDREGLTNAFKMLSEGGKVKGELTDAPWGDTFGWFEDKFGVNWMINISKGD